jgi:hypothetical protein
MSMKSFQESPIKYTQEGGFYKWDASKDISPFAGVSTRKLLLTEPPNSRVYPSVKDTNGNYYSTDANGNTIDTLGSDLLYKESRSVAASGRGQGVLSAGGGPGKCSRPDVG